AGTVPLGVDHDAPEARAPHGVDRLGPQRGLGDPGETRLVELEAGRRTVGPNAGPAKTEGAKGALRPRGPRAPFRRGLRSRWDPGGQTGARRLVGEMEPGVRGDGPGLLFSDTGVEEGRQDTEPPGRLHARAILSEIIDDRTVDDGLESALARESKQEPEKLGP